MVQVLCETLQPNAQQLSIVIHCCLCFVFVRLCKPRGADHGASPFCCGEDVRHAERFESRQRSPQATALRLHRQRRSSPGQKHTYTHRLLTSKHTLYVAGWVPFSGQIQSITVETVPTTYLYPPVYLRTEYDYCSLHTACFPYGLFTI